MPKISVLVPIYGVEKYLKECIDSILNQTFTDLEILLIDDGGKDACPQICDEYAKIDSRIKVIHKTNGGYGTAINAGLKNASGEYIGIVESDDYIQPEMYEEYYKCAKKYDVDIVKGVYYEIAEDGSNKKLARRFNNFPHAPEKFNIREYLYPLNHHASIWSGIYKKSFIDKYNIIMFEKNKGRYADQVWRIETLALADSIHWVEKPFYNYRVFTPNNTTSVKGAKTPDDIFDLYVELNDFFKAHKEIYQAIKLNYFAEIYFHTSFNLGRCDRSFMKYILIKFKKMFSKQISINDINCIDILSKREKMEFVAMLRGSYYPIYVWKKIIKFVFSVTNSNDRKSKIITILGLKLKIRKRMLND